MEKYIRDIRLPRPNYKRKILFNNKTIYIGTPTCLRDFMKGMGMELNPNPLLLNNRIVFPQEWDEIILHHQDNLVIEELK
ncbi:MAG: hypothetical protein RR212_10780 [Bacteroidales bacterium]